MRKKAVARAKILIVMQQEMCAFTKNAGENFFAPSKNKNSKVILLGDNKARQIRHGIGAALGDQQVHSVYCTYFAYLLNLCHI